MNETSAPELVSVADPARGLRLTGKFAVVTAAAQGIGRATAVRLADEGASVLALDINGDGLREIVHPRVNTIPADATDAAQMAGALASVPRIDILVNCVGWVHHGTILDCSPEEWKRAFRLNVDTIFDLIRLVLPGMKARGSGSIVNIASLAGLRAAPNRAAYAATKAAVVGLTRSVAIDFAGCGVRCNAICPAMVDTPSLTERIDALPDPVAARALFISRHPVGRLGRPEEVAALAAYLASDESAFMTGAALQLDGGAAA
ncbi:MAG: SDR family oxidoreductase [Betaproteobacteria bacterium]